MVRGGFRRKKDSYSYIYKNEQLYTLYTKPLTNYIDKQQRSYSTARGICPVVALRYEADALHDRGSYLEEQDGFPLGKKYFPRAVGGLT